MTIATKNRKGEMGPEHVKTLEKAVTIDGAQVITGTLVISRGTATTALDYLYCRPTNQGVGNPYLAVAKGASAGDWAISLWDGVNNAGTINISAGNVRANNVDIATVAGPVFTLPPRLPSYTVATLPSAATYVRGLIYVSDGTGNKRLAISDSTNWRWPDGAIVS